MPKGHEATKLDTRARQVSEVIEVAPAAAAVDALADTQEVVVPDARAIEAALAAAERVIHTS